MYSASCTSKSYNVVPRDAAIGFRGTTSQEPSASAIDRHVNGVAMLVTYAQRSIATTK